MSRLPVRSRYREDIEEFVKRGARLARKGEYLPRSRGAPVKATGRASKFGRQVFDNNPALTSR